MQETPSQLPNLSIYETWQQAPDHFNEHVDLYARQVWIGVIELFLATTDFGPLERAIQQHTLPVVADMYLTALPTVLKAFPELVEITARYLKPNHKS